MSNNLFEILEIERGITADEFEANDDPGKITSPVWGLGFRIYFDFFFFVVHLYILQDSCTLCSLFRLCFVKRKQKTQKWTFIVSFPNRLSTKIAWIVSRNKSSPFIVCFSTFAYSFSSALSAAFYFQVYVPVSASRAIAIVPQPVELKPLSFAFLLCSA